MKPTPWIAIYVLPLIALPSVSAQAQARVSTQAEPWGKTVDGHPATRYTLSDGELTVRIVNYGARVVEIDAPDRTGTKADVVLGLKDLGSYEKPGSGGFMGAVVGRYGNRIANGTFTLDGRTVSTAKNDNGNTLHGGAQGFYTKVWSARTVADGVQMTLVSPDGDMGFPGRLTVTVTYTLAASSLHIRYEATTTKLTVVNLTNHSYFNLSGESSGDVLKEIVEIPADRITPISAQLIPTGALADVEGSPFDFRTPTAIGARIGTASGYGADQLQLAGGYDHNWALNGEPGVLHEAAKVVDPASGRTLTVTTTEPGVQFYTGNHLKGDLTGPGGAPYGPHAGFCLETQHFPDSPNHPNFPSTELEPGQTFHSETVFAFGVER